MSESMKANTNIVHKDHSGTHTIKVWAGREKDGYWNGYAYNGHILSMTNPKKGTIVQMPRGNYYRIVNLGVVNMGLDNTQMNAVFIKRWKP